MKNLMQLGYTEYEARVYLALLKNPDSTGYEASRISGVPRAKVYEAMESLERKGAAISNNVEGKQLYRALPPSMLIARHRRQTEEVLKSLEPALIAVENKQSPDAVLTVRGLTNVIELAKQLLRQAQARVMITGLPGDLSTLALEISACAERGVKVFVLSYGPLALEGAQVIEHSVSGLQYLQVAALGRWFALTTDHGEALLAQLTDQDNTSALWTRHPMVVFGIEGWITHDITLFRTESLLSEVRAELPPWFLERISQTVDELQPLWTIGAAEILREERVVPDITPEIIQQRLKSRFSGYRGLSGNILFELGGKGGGRWLLELWENGVNIDLNPQQAKYDLLVQMDIQDFKALLCGALPLAAFVTKGRMKVEGDLVLASALQSLSGWEDN